MCCHVCKWDTEKWFRTVNRIIHKKYDRNVFICCQSRQHEKGGTAPRVLMERIHYALSLKQVVKAMKRWWGPVKGYYFLESTCPLFPPLGESSWVELDCSSPRANSLFLKKPSDLEPELLATCKTCAGYRHIKPGKLGAPTMLRLHLSITAGRCQTQPEMGL